ncbi:MAG: helix-turn-helix domain-containing protein [Nanoarchaeota archaeon]|nr:helix-turn-helix domain-containing protein [Nanoarchaeota archaeon]
MDELQFTKEEEKKVVLLSTNEVAEKLGTSARAIRYLAEGGKLPSHKIKQGESKIKYMFELEKVEEWERKRKLPSSQREGRRGASFLLLLREKEALKERNEEIVKKMETLMVEVGRWQGGYKEKEEQVRQIQHLLTERAESLYQKEAKVKELEDKLQKYTWQMEEELQREKKEKELMRTIAEEEKKGLEEEARKVKEEIETAKAMREEEKENLAQEILKMKKEAEIIKKEKEELTRILLFKNTPWWKKIFYTKEQLEKKIEKEFNKSKEALN